MTTMTTFTRKNTYNNIRKDVNKFARKNEAATIAIVATTTAAAAVGIGTAAAAATRGVRRGIGAIRAKIATKKADKLNDAFDAAMAAADNAIAAATTTADAAATTAATAETTAEAATVATANNGDTKPEGTPDAAEKEEK